MALRAGYYGIKKRILDKILPDYITPGVMTNEQLTEKVTPQIVPITTDANTLTNEGTYLYKSLITDAPTIHLPSEMTNRYARIEVKTINGTSQLTQVLYTHNKTDFWTRALNNGTFTNWFKFSGTEVAA